MKTIYKYPLVLTDGVQDVLIPAPAKVVSVGLQADICVWAEVEPGAAPVLRQFQIVGTGHPLPEDDQMEHLGRVDQGMFVWHVYGR